MKGFLPPLYFSYLGKFFFPPSEARTVVKWKMEAGFCVAILTCLLFRVSGEWGPQCPVFLPSPVEEPCPWERVWKKAETEPGLHGSLVKDDEQGERQEPALPALGPPDARQLLKWHLDSRAEGQGDIFIIMCCYLSSLWHAPGCSPTTL